MARILQIITLSEVGGAQQVVLQIASALAAAGHEVDVACRPGGGWLEERLSQKGIWVIPLPRMRREIAPRDDIATIQHLVHLIRSRHYDLVHCHSTKAGTLGRIAAAMASTPALFTVHGWAFSHGVPLRRRLMAMMAERLLASRTERIICVSEYDRDLALRYRIADSKRLIVIHNGIPDLPRPMVASRARDSVCIVMVARFSRPKDQSTLIQAASHLRGDWGVWLVGDGRNLASAKALVQHLDIENRVRFWGERMDAAALMAQCDIVALISHWEGLPISILEGMRAGLPVVATDVGGVDEAVRHGVNGFLVQRGDVQALTYYLQLLLDNPILRTMMGNQSRSFFEKYFTEDKMIDALMQLYNSLIG